MSRLYYEQEDDEIPQKSQVELQVLDQYWVLIEYSHFIFDKTDKSVITEVKKTLECYVDIESQNSARQTIERIKRYIETHYYDGEYTIINMCKL